MIHCKLKKIFNYRSVVVLILTICCFSCTSKGKSSSIQSTPETNDTLVTPSVSKIENDAPYRDTIYIDYLRHKSLLTILKMLPESSMASWEWNKTDREKTVAFIEKNNFMIDSTEMYYNIEYLEPNAIGIQVIDGFWTLSIYKFTEDDYFVVTNDRVGDGNDIHTFNFKDGELSPTKMRNWFGEFDKELVLTNSNECLELLEDNLITFEFQFGAGDYVEIGSWFFTKNNSENCFKGNTIAYKINRAERTFDISRIYWKSKKNE